MSINNANTTFDAQDFSVTGTYFTTDSGSLMQLVAGVDSIATLTFALLRTPEAGNGQELLSVNLAYEISGGSLTTITPTLDILEQTGSGETVIPVVVTASGFSTAVGDHIGVLTLTTPMFDTDADNRLLRFRIVFNSASSGRKVLIRSSEAVYDHEMISRDSEFAGCTVSTRIDALPYTISAAGKYRVDSALAIGAGGTGVTISADDVCLEFCCGGSIAITGTNTVGISVGAVDNAKVCNAVLNGVASNGHVGISVNATTNIDICGGIYTNLEQVVPIATGSGKIVVDGLSMTGCNNGVVVVRGSTITELQVKNCVVSHTQLWNFVEMDGICTNCSVEHNRSEYGKIWSWQCTNCSTRRNKIHMPILGGALPYANFIIGCGGWRPTTPPAPSSVPAGDKFGCSACRVEYNQITVGGYVAVTSPPVIIGSIVCQYCKGCTIENNNVSMGDPQATIGLPLGILTGGPTSSYCDSCSYWENHTADASFGFFTCDLWDENVFCKNSTLLGCTACECYYGFVGQRCHGLYYRECTTTDGHVGFYISEGAIGATVDTCHVVTMSHAGVWNLRSTGGGTEQLITDPFLAPPVKTVVRRSSFIETTNGIYAGDVGAQPGDGTPYGSTADNNIVIA